MHLAMSDTLSVIGGKWKPLLITIFLVEGKKQFRQLSREISVSRRILSKELAELELNKLVSRTVRDTRPVTVEYAATDYCETLKEVILVMSNWGSRHREVITGRNQAHDHYLIPNP